MTLRSLCLFAAVLVTLSIVPTTFAILSSTRKPTETLVTQVEREQTEVRKVLQKLRKLSTNSSIDTAAKDNGLFEDDMMLTLEQAEELYDYNLNMNDHRQKRKALSIKTRLWDSDDAILYTFQNFTSNSDKTLIQRAIRVWESKTCLKFKLVDPLSNTSNGIIFRKIESGCSSLNGKSAKEEPQYISLSRSCMHLSILVHQIGHALGMYHEHSRPDRDAHVRISWSDGKEKDGYEIKKNVQTYGIPYDMGSIMHYGTHGYKTSSKNMKIETVDPAFQGTIGQMVKPSFNDFRLLNKMYCSDTCPKKLNCQRNGYPHPKNCRKCICPAGFRGKHCESVSPGSGAKCGGIVQIKDDWNNSVKSPNYPTRSNKTEHCTWLLKADKGKVIEFNIHGQFKMNCRKKDRMCNDYVEIRKTADFSNTGIRVCCDSAPNSTFTSTTNEMLIIMSSKKRSTGFQSRARSRRA